MYVPTGTYRRLACMELSGAVALGACPVDSVDMAFLPALGCVIGLGPSILVGSWRNRQVSPARQPIIDVMRTVRHENCSTRELFDKKTVRHENVGCTSAN